MAGVPADTHYLDDDNSYPKGLKIFTQYVLIPLASVYVIILLAYEVKILVQWNLPKGTVSDLILGYAVYGILSILLIYPLRNQEENRWIRTYARSFYFLLIPLLILLFLAVFTRILPYGITAPRYFLIVLACWLLFITGYFLLSRKQNIKIIPFSLFIVTVLSVYGPQSAFSVASYSQRSILKEIFKKYGALKNGKLTSLQHIKVNDIDGEKIREKLNYFVYDADLASLQPYINKDISFVIDSVRSRQQDKKGNSNSYEIKNEQIQWLENYVGAQRFDSSVTYNKTTNYTFENKNQLLKIKGYDYIINLNSFNFRNDTTVVTTDSVGIKQWVTDSHLYKININRDTVLFDIKTIALGLKERGSTLGSFLKDNSLGYKNYEVPGQLLKVTKQTKNFKITLQIEVLSYSYTNNKDIQINRLDGYYLISKLR